MGRHHPGPARLRRAKQFIRRQRTRTAWTVTAIVIAAGTWWGAGTVLADIPAGSPNTATIPVTALEQNYLDELHHAGVDLDAVEGTTAVQIAQKHVAHNHLTGMRDDILADFRFLIPRLTDEQREAALSVLSHHFQDVTGRKQ